VNFTTEIPLIFLFGCFGFAFLAAAILYYRAPGEFSKFQKRGLAILRGASVFFICFLLLSPQINFKREVIEKPILIVGVDNSSSCVSGSDSLQIRENLPGILSGFKDDLSEKYEVDFFLFGEQVKPGNDVAFSGQLSDYGSFLSDMEARYYGRNIGALLMVGDGNFNRGNHPLNKLKELQIPSYSLAVGDTVRPADQVVRAVRANPTSFLAAKFPVEVNFEIFNFEGRKTEARILQNEKVIVRKAIDIHSDDFFSNVRLYVQPEKKGLQEYMVELIPLDGELNLKNNRRKLVVNVLENRRKILVLTSGPHPDIGALKNALKKRGDFEVKVQNIKDYKNKLSGTHLIVLYQLPQYSSVQSIIWKQIAAGRTPCLIVAGPQTNWEQLNLLNLGVNIPAITGMTDLSEVAVNNQFGLFEIPSGMPDVVSGWPPLMVPFGDPGLSEGLRVLFYQRIKGMETNKPLLAVGKIGNRKVGVLLGEGIWRWRINEYRRFENHNHFDQLFSGVIQFLAMQENEDNFIIQHEQNYASNEMVEFRAEVYDDNFLPVINAEVILNITGEEDRLYEYSFTGDDSGYSLNVGKLPAGNYRFEGKAVLGEEEWMEKGAFMVTEVEVEMLTNMANHRWMYQAAAETGGEVFFLSQLEKLKRALLMNGRAKARQIVTEKQTGIIHHKLVWILILILLAAEWFLRKYWGSY